MCHDTQSMRAFVQASQVNKLEKYSQRETLALVVQSQVGLIFFPHEFAPHLSLRKEREQKESRGEAS